MPIEPASATPSPRIRVPLAWLVWSAAVLEAALVGASPILFPRLFATAMAGEKLEFAAFLVTIALVVMAFATAGLLVTRQQPRNAVGWLMLVGGPAVGAVFVGYLVGVSLVEAGSGVGSWFVLGAGVLFGPALYLLGPGLGSVFPTGRPLPGPWTGFFWLSTAGIVLGAFLVAFAPGQLDEGIPVANPLGFGVLPTGLRAVGNALTGVALVGSALVSLASLVARYARATSETRHQLKWFLYAGVVGAIALPVSLIAGETWTAIIVLVALAFLPIAVVVAVLRYRLYEIDTLINRTLVYVPLVGIVAGLYAGSVALLQRLFTATTGDTSDAAAVISALALATVFTPIRNAIQSAVDRRFKADARSPASPWDGPEFRAAVEAIVRDVTRAPALTVTHRRLGNVGVMSR